MTGHRAGHQSPQVLTEITGSMAGHDGRQGTSLFFCVGIRAWFLQIEAIMLCRTFV
jgi:hypothetical protein